MKKQSFFRRTVIPLFLAIVLVTIVQMIPRYIPKAYLPSSMDEYQCQVSLLENGKPTDMVYLTAAEGEDLYQRLATAKVMSWGLAKKDVARSASLYRVYFDSPGDGEDIEVFFNGEQQVYAGGRLYKLQGAEAQGIPDELARFLASSDHSTALLQ